MLKDDFFTVRKDEGPLSIEVAGDLLKVTWERAVNQRVNFLNEDLFLRLRTEDGTYLFEKKVSHLLGTECELPDDMALFFVELFVRKRLSLCMRSAFHYTPSITLVSENERRHHLYWRGIDWEGLKDEVQAETGFEWGKDVHVLLHIRRWPDEVTRLPLEEFSSPGLSDHSLILGSLKEVGLEVWAGKEKERKRFLKGIFSVGLDAEPGGRRLCFTSFRYPGRNSFIRLKREVWEGDTLQLRAFWSVTERDWSFIESDVLEPAGLTWNDTYCSIRLFTFENRQEVEWRPEEVREILPGTNDWLFTGLKRGRTYKARLVLVPKAEDNKGPIVLLESNNVSIPFEENRIVLMPIDHTRIYAWWHIDQDSLSEMLSRSSKGEGQIKTYIKVYHDFAGSLYHHADKDVEIHLGIHNNWYLNVDPDRVYRAEIVLVSGHGEAIPITPVSNPVQTMRTETGRLSVEYKEVHHNIDHPTLRPLRSRMDTLNHSKGLLVIHLHAHLPFLKKRVVYGTSGVWQPLGFPEEWFYEAVRETYIPLLLMMESLRREGVDFRLSMDISPTLSNMMRCPMLQEEFLRFMDAHISLVRAEVERTRREAPKFFDTACMHLERFHQVRNLFLRYDCDLTKAYREFQEQGYLEISTCAATHGFLPFYTMTPEGMRCQIKSAVEDYISTFGRRPLGIWLPECAYTPGIEKYLQENGLLYFFSETHGILVGDAPSAFGIHAPVYIKGSDVACFARDPETGKQVWSGDEGYPGDPDYLEFHIRGGPLKYNRITSRASDYKEPYVRAWAMEKAARHAQHFMESRNFKFNYLQNQFWKKPLIVSMYDAELFGHHWYEGPEFLYYLLKKLYYNQNETELITPSGYLKRYPRNQDMSITPSSWGDKGTFDKWMYGSVSWMYRHVHEALREFEAMLQDFRQNDKNPKDFKELKKRVLKQSAREVLQSMNSDIAFAISNGHFVDKMKQLFFTSTERFWELQSMYWNIETERDLEARLLKMELENPIFPDLSI